MGTTNPKSKIHNPKFLFALLPDWSLLVSDDKAGAIYRIAYAKK